MLIQDNSDHMTGHQGSKTIVRCAAGETDDFTVTVGLHQGSAPSPFLFAMIRECFSRDIQRDAPWDTLFTDDVVINAEIGNQDEERLQMWKDAKEKRGMRKIRKKTEYLRLDEGTIGYAG